MPGRATRLVLVLAVALGLRLAFALAHHIDYNAYQAVFIARNLPREYHLTAHPPLYFAAVAAAAALSRTELAYQAVALLAGVGVVALVRVALLRLRASAVVADLAALAMAVAMPAIILSTGVQSYMLGTLFIMLSFPFYLDLVRPQPVAGRRSRAAFAVLATLAMLTEYFTAFYLLACATAPLLVALFRPAYARGLLRAIPRRLAADVLTLLPALAVGSALYVLQARPWLVRMVQFQEFYFKPGEESAAAFLIRGLASLFRMFSPIDLGAPAAAALAVAGFAALVFALAAGEPPEDRRAEPDEAGRAVPAAMLIVLLMTGLAMGLMAAHPFGGGMRQHFLYFLFAVLAGFVAFDVLLRRVAERKARAALAGLVVLVLAVNLASHRGDFRNAAGKDFDRQVRAFQRAFPDAATIQVDELNLIGFFMQYHDWDWRFTGLARHDPLIVGRYQLERDGKTLTLLAHRNRWNLDFNDAAIYPDLAGALGPGEADCFAVFCVHTNLYKPPERRLPDLDPASVTARISALAAQAGLVPQKTVFEGNDVYAGFCRAPE